MAFKNNFGIFKIPKDLGGVWIQTICIFSFFFFFLVVNVDFLCEQRIRALFTRPTNITFSSIFIKTGFYDIIHTFKNYFATLFSVFSYIQTDPKILHLEITLDLMAIFSTTPIIPAVTTMTIDVAETTTSRSF